MKMEITHSVTKERLNWIDWMKTIGIYLIVVGHFMPIGNEIIYIFSVPLFFLISGFLNNRKDSAIVFFKKLYVQLIIPMLIFVVLGRTFDAIIDFAAGKFSLNQYVYGIGSSIIGFQGINGKSALGACWFIYSLCLCKIISQFISDRWQLLIAIACIIMSYCFNYYNLNISHAVLNVMVAFPIFFIGIRLKQYKSILNSLKIVSPYCLVSLLVSIVALIFAYIFNDTPWMYKNGFGKDYMVFLLGAIAGTYIIYWISKLLIYVKLGGGGKYFCHRDNRYSWSTSPNLIYHFCCGTYNRILYTRRCYRLFYLYHHNGDNILCHSLLSEILPHRPRKPVIFKTIR